ncbi:MAG TPA: hypothetical protein VHO06_14355 [Polyangia bacterium]|nr:hypothetical protein [Polyangia bacterium]
MADQNDIAKRGAQALLATYLQMTRHAEMAQGLHHLRRRAVERRMREAPDMGRAVGVQRQLEAQQNQGTSIGEAVRHLHGRAPELASFAEAGLTFEDYQRMGLDHLVTREAVDEARRRGSGKTGDPR